ncbi:MAG: 2-succinyl-5-enolpyruvyl-6-hydroxy-3-cyclohexene-1-carboxylic-acid synthase [Sandaracinaceae bacterium]|nr:2-succinyl-5-enolpyruvyl-6-hydroxy-3-cyclohexene-1-carboxylic-acid synthase [Sandaracinaceae bacterium]
MSAPANLLTVWADVLLGALAAAGVRDVVASPGSRSTPFVLAAARHPALTLRVVVDERSAGFFALGLARAGGAPPLLLSTSGTAPAHYYPAVIEASEAGLPLLVLSADRPAALVRAGAPQTTDQTRLYGVHARAFADLGLPEGTDAALATLAQTARWAVERALGPEPGPVQLNAPADKPLEPVQARTDEERALVDRAAGLALGGPAPRARPSPDAAALAALADALARAERPVLYAGPLGADAPRDTVLDFARRVGVTVLAEASSQLRFGPRDGVRTADAFDWWLGESPTPDLVLEVGATPTSSRTLEWLGRGARVPRFVVGGTRRRDPAGTARAVVLGELGDLLDAIGARVVGVTRERGDDAFAVLEERAWARVEACLADAPFGEAHATRCVLERAPEGARLVLGNSLPIRHVDRYVRGGGRRLRILSQRGVNGIDGTLAGAAGAAAASGEPTLALLGDVAFAHDVGSLALAAHAPGPLVLVVLDNGGGRIFEELPVARAGVDMTLFTTPTALDLAAAARTFGLAYAEAAGTRALEGALDEALARRGATLVRVVVPPHGAAALVRAIQERA